MRIYIIVYMLFFTGCSVKEYKLFQDDNSEHTNNMKELSIRYSSKIISGDILDIEIYNLNKKSNIAVQSSLLTPISIKENNLHMVSSEGSIYLPLLGEIQVIGLTKKELRKVLISKYQRYLKAPYVKIKIKNYKIYVFGEVGKAGVVNIDNDSISLLELISKAGNLTNYSIRSSIKVISPVNGKYWMRSIDLTKFSTLNNTNLMVPYNSIVYIEPKYTKAINVQMNDYLPFLQSLTTALGSYLAIDYLIKGQ